MLTVILEEVKSQLAEFKGYTFKLGFYSEFSSKRLVVMIEVLNEVKSYSADEETSKDVFEYFKKYPLKNPVYKIYFNFHTFLNGVLYNNPNILLTPHDSLELRWSATKKVRVPVQDYLIFLY